MDGSGTPHRDWDEWPGMESPPDRPRRGLRALFAPTADGTDEIEELIDARGRELEERAASLRVAIADLEDREERVRNLRATIEALLREGSAELDGRHAELAGVAQELAEREQRLALAEADVEERRTELGAVELRRAAVERREQAAADRQAELERLAGELRERAAEVEEHAAALDRVAPAPAVDASAPTWRTDVHLLVVPGDGYSLMEAPGPPPAPGALVELQGTRYRVTRGGRSPLPADDRRCCFLEAV